VKDEKQRVANLSILSYFATVDLHRYLYDILSNKFAQDEKIPVLIACNKSDLLTAFKKERIQTMLEAEM